jgi:hypothetical protein
MCNWLSILIFKQCQIGFVIFLLFYRNCCNCCPQFFINVLYGETFCFGTAGLRCNGGVWDFLHCEF